MKWFAAHAVIATLVPQSGGQVDLHENIYIIHGIDANDAKDQAVKLAKEAMSGFDGAWYSEDPDQKQVEYFLVGVRKVVNIFCAHSNEFDLNKISQIRYTVHPQGDHLEILENEEFPCKNIL